LALVSSHSEFEQAWGDLAPMFRICLDQAWSSLRSRGLPVGAVISFDDESVSRGRNRVYDPPGGSDPLQRTPLAHAEMNAIAAVLPDIDLSGCWLWTTQEPCSMCRAAIDFTEMAGVGFLASDPSAASANRFVSSGGSDEIWIVVANTLFLHNIAWVGGKDNPMLERNRLQESEVVSLALNLLEGGSLIDPAGRGVSIEETLAEVWEQVKETSIRRLARLGNEH
jgi:tRNA(Arg) A34 adenosine deaminase TadA